MLAIATSGIGKIDATAPQGTKVKERDDKAVDTFASLMNASAFSNTDVSDVKADTTPKTKTVQKTDKVSDQTSKTDGSPDNLQAKDTSRTETKTETAETDGPAASKKDGNVEKTVGNPSDEGKTAVTEEIVTAEENTETLLQEELLSLLQNLVEMLQDQLGITGEDMNRLLDQMNLEIGDLLDVTNLKAFVLQANQATEVDLLINEDLNRTVNELTDGLTELLQEYEVTDGESVKAAYEALPETVKAQAGSEVLAAKDAKLETDVPKMPDKTVKTESLPADGEILTPDLEEGQETAHADTDSRQGADSFVEHLNNAVFQAVSRGEVTETAEFADNIQEMDIIRQIIDEVKVGISKEVTSLELQLNPEHLGKVQISVTTKNGMMQAQIVAETEAARQAIEGNLSVLRETFQNQELKVEAIEVMVATYEFFREGQNEQFEENRQKQAEKRTGGINLGEEVPEEELTEPEILEVEMMKARGNRVSYSI